MNIIDNFHMAIITAGTGATIQASTLEGQFIQTIEYFQELEQTGGNTTSYFSGSYDSDTRLFDGSFNVPVSLTGTAIAFVGKTEGFLTGTFTPGSGGTFTAATALDYFLQVLARFIKWQTDPAKNPTLDKNMTASINIATSVLSGNFNLPFTKAMTPSGISFTPKEYLLT